MKSGRSVLILVVSLIAILAACSPKAGQAPPRASGTPQASATPIAANAAWQKVVEAARKEGKLSVYSFNLTGDVGTAVTKAFKEAYGIDMEVVTGPGAQLVERIKSERRAGQFLVDVMDGSPALLIQSKQDGNTVKWSELPALQEKGVWSNSPVLDKEGHIIWWNPSIYMPYYNTTLVKPEELPKSWKDFLAPKWKGKIAISNPDTVPTLNRFYAIMTSRNVLTGSYFQDLSKQDVKFYPTFRDDIAATARGEAYFDFANAPNVANALLKQGAPIRPFDMPEGMTASGSAVVAIQTAPHPNAAQVYENWLLSKAGQTVVHEIIGASNDLRTDVPDFTPPGAKVTVTKFFTETEADVVEENRLQQEHVISKMFGKQ